MGDDTPFLEYLIIGSQATLALYVVIYPFLGISFDDLSHIEASTFVLALPFVYLLGILLDAFAFTFLRFFQNKIKSGIFAGESYKDEIIGLYSKTLYAAYEVRLKRARVMGASIITWFLTGIAGVIIFFAKSMDMEYLLFVSPVSAFIFVTSIFAWRSYLRRAYNFRKNAYVAISSANFPLPPEIE